MSYRKVISLAILSIAILISCKSNKRLDAGPQDAVTPSSDGLALLQMSDLTFATVSPLRLDQPDFRVNGIRVGVQQFILYDTPIVSYKLPAQADYIEILRCPYDREIYGGADVLQYVEDHANAEEENRIFQANNFWQAAVATPFCVLVAPSFSDPYFFDASASTGKYYYYIHACVDPQRMEKLTNVPSNNCSRQVTRSVMFDFFNKRRQTDLVKFSQVADLQGRQATLTRQIVHLTQVLGAALVHCQSAHQSAVASAEKRATIINYATLAGGVAGALAGGVYGAASTTKASSTATKVGGGVMGTLAGGAAGALTTYLLGSGIDAMTRPLPIAAGDDPTCYDSKPQTEIDSLVNSYQDEATKGTSVARPCSCGDANVLGLQIQALTREVQSLQTMLQKTVDSMKTSNSKAPTP